MGIEVDHAVDGEVLLVVTAAVDENGGIGPVGSGLAGSAGVDHAGNGLQEGKEVATFERMLVELGAGDDAGALGAGQLKRCSFGSDVDRLHYVAHLERQPA